MRRMLLPILLLGSSTVVHAQTSTPKPAYDFSLPREERIKLAEGAAPPEISGKATVYLLERTGYVKVREGTNGFSCFVDRQTPLNLALPLLNSAFRVHLCFPDLALLVLDGDLRAELVLLDRALLFYRRIPPIVDGLVRLLE